MKNISMQSVNCGNKYYNHSSAASELLSLIWCMHWLVTVNTMAWTVVDTLGMYDMAMYIVLLCAAV